MNIHALNNMTVSKVNDDKMFVFGAYFKSKATVQNAE